ncbi:hypothetical protein V6N13_106774 [Hibiscus sabdariffa]
MEKRGGMSGGEWIKARIEWLNTDLSKRKCMVLGVCSRGDGNHDDKCDEENYWAERDERHSVEKRKW